MGVVLVSPRGDNAERCQHMHAHASTFSLQPTHGISIQEKNSMIISASSELPPPSFPISLHRKTLPSREREERLRERYERWIVEEGEGVEVNEDDSI